MGGSHGGVAYVVCLKCEISFKILVFGSCGYCELKEGKILVFLSRNICELGQFLQLLGVAVSFP